MIRLLTPALSSVLRRVDHHYHLLVETSEPNLGRAMPWLNVSC
jgi:hypothetical protein